MDVERFSFQNRHGLTIVGEIWHPHNAKGMAIVQHGMTSGRNRPHIQLTAKLFCEAGYTTIAFDATHSWNESDGDPSHVTLTSHSQDMEDVIGWAQTQSFYQEPFILAGYSFGGFSVLHLTQKYPEKVKAILPGCAVLSGKLRLEAYERYEPDKLISWQKTGFQERIKNDDPSIRTLIPYSLIDDALQHDVLEKAHEITCPALLIVGEQDTSTPAYQQEMLRDALNGPTKMVVIPNAPHTFRKPHELQALEDAIRPWLQSL